MTGTIRRLAARTRSAAAALLVAGGVAGCSAEVGLEEEARFGAQAAAEIGQQVSLVRDPAAVGALNRIGDELASHADPSPREYTFYLVDSEDINAFALPGGHIFVNTGLIAEADNASELAGVLGHEIAHVTQRHGLEQVEKQRGANLLLSLLYMLLGREPGILEQVAIQGGGAAVFAKYSRDAEREADREAIETLLAAGYDPAGVANFFEDLLRQQQNAPGRLEQWFASHPTSQERVQSARAVIEALPAQPRAGAEAPATGEFQQLRARIAALGGAPVAAPPEGQGGRY